jgi:ABC-2 type transport system ATP-binding protein
MKAILLENLTKSFDGIEVLKSMNISIEEGEFYCLMGPNGSGKTTLVSILASVVLPTSGRVEILGRSPDGARDLMGYVPQANFTSPALTGRENLVYFARLYGHSRSDSEKLAGDLVGKVGLKEDADKRVADYSGGMRKRLEVATALFPGIRVLLLDEPTTGLDPSARRRFFGLIQDIKSDEVTILLITHLGSDAELASRVGLIDFGKIIAEDEPENLKRSSDLENVINLETAVKHDRVIEALRGFSVEGKVMETELGYRIYSRESERDTPLIIRALDEIDAKVIQIQSTPPSLEDIFFKLTGRSVGEGN